VQIREGRRVRRLRSNALSAHGVQSLSEVAQRRLQVLPVLRELQLRPLHHREVLREWATVRRCVNYTPFKRGSWLFELASCALIGGLIKRTLHYADFAMVCVPDFHDLRPRLSPRRSFGESRRNGIWAFACILQKFIKL